MTASAAERLEAPGGAAMVTAAVFLSAVLVFLVQPLVGRLLLPSLGGAPAVWNTSLVFFQAALLAGYAYAHWLQRIRSIRAQAAVHMAVLLVAGTVLPLQVTDRLGPPSPEQPAAWLLGVLALSLGAPFAALSATAPLMQAWWAARFGERLSPYPLYAASNLGSLAALLAYPLAIEPLLTLQTQRLLWTTGYALFLLAAVAAAWTMRAAVREPVAAAHDASGVQVWRQRLWWALLGAIPSSLLLGVTAHISTDVASAPFLWVVPLALYLLTFVLAFQERPVLSPRAVLVLQAAAVTACLALMSFHLEWRLLLALHLTTFFLTAMLCHGRLATDRPRPARLTEFYLALSVGGVLGGAFNALLAPSLFDLVWEYPLALILAAVARPVGPPRLQVSDAALVTAGVAAAVFAATESGGAGPDLGVKLALGAAAGAAFLLRNRAPAFMLTLAALFLASTAANAVYNYVRTERSFFGVYRVAYNTVPELGPVRFLLHGTTVHGAQRADPTHRCEPISYYAPGTPMEQAVAAVQSRGPARIGVVGLGAGTLAAYIRREDSARFFEVDPVVADLARTSFSYIGACARGALSVVIGDARLTVGREPAGAFDLLVVDAFSSDAVPTHLMTVEAMRGWLRPLKPDGLLVLHISNRNLDLEPPVAAAVRAAGAWVVVQRYSPPRDAPALSTMTSHVVAASRHPETLRRLGFEGPWRAPPIEGGEAWTDDRTDVLGALLRDFGTD